MIPDLLPGWVRCERCEGKGYRTERETRPFVSFCPACEGEGVVVRPRTGDQQFVVCMTKRWPPGHLRRESVLMNMAKIANYLYAGEHRA